MKQNILKNKWCADFETDTTLINETFVYAWAINNIENIEENKIGSSVESFIDYCMKNPRKILFP